MRRPAVAGQFYEDDFQRLEKQIHDSFFAKQGPGDLPLNKRVGNIIGVISPHAGYAFSGPCAAWAYKEIAEARFPDTFIILGTSHQGSKGIFLTKQDFDTPFGIVKTDKELAEIFLKSGIVNENDAAHGTEHSIEVQLPFLQFVSKKYLSHLRILPIIIGEYDERLAELITEQKKSIVVIVSGDFTHYGPNYGYTPFLTNVKEGMYRLDEEAIELIRRLDTEEFLNFERDKTICGALPISILMDICKLKKGRAIPLHYYTSGDIIDGYNNAVGYASILFK